MTSNVLEMPLKYFRTTIAQGTPGVDREGGEFGFGVIRGASIITQGEALGHDMWIDGEFLAAVTAAIDTSATGIKARFTHPGLSSDGLGQYLGKVRNARLRGKQVIADLHFAESSTKTPDGNLADYVMTLAEETPEDFGISIVFDVDAEAMQAFTETNTQGGRYVSPDEDNKENYPHARMRDLRAADVVDTPAANPSGLFHREQQAAVDAEGLMSFALGLSDEHPTLQALSVDADRVKASVARFLSRHGLMIVKESDMATDSPAGAEPATIPQPTREEFAAECKRFIAAFGAKGGEWFADGKSFSECQGLMLQHLQESLAAKDVQIAELQSRLAAIDLGENEPAKFGDAAPAEKPKANNLRSGFASRISINGSHN